MIILCVIQGGEFFFWSTCKRQFAPLQKIFSLNYWKEMRPAAGIQGRYIAARLVTFIYLIDKGIEP